MQLSDGPMPFASRAASRVSNQVARAVVVRALRQRPRFRGSSQQSWERV